MREHYELIKKDADELKTMCLQAMISSDIDYIDEEGFKAMQITLRLVNNAMKFSEAQIAAFERIEEKLDKLLAKN